MQVLVFGCAYERIADGTCSATTLRDRRDEWIELEVMEDLRGLALEAYYRFSSGWNFRTWRWTLHHQGPMRRREGRKEPPRQGKAGHQTLHGGRRSWHPLGHRHRPGQPPRFAALLVTTLEHAGASVGGLP